MKRIPVTNFSENRLFKTKLNLNKQTFNPSITKIDNSISTTITNITTSISTSVNTSSSPVETKSDINNQPVEDIYYDEIVYYDGGGVEGYGD